MKNLIIDNYNKMGYSPAQLQELKQAFCDHKDTSIVVLEIVANCEKTALKCDYCGEIVTKPKTDCR